MQRPLKTLRISILALGLLLALGASSAGATQRFAAPGAKGGAPCTQQIPCSITGAVSVAEAGDEVVLAPGAYSDSAGDLTALNVNAGVSLHGAIGAARPVITLDADVGTSIDPGFFVATGATVSHIEIKSAARRNMIDLGGGTIDDVIARSSFAGSLTEKGIACTVISGVVRDSACLSSGSNGIGLGAEGFVGPQPPATVALRNVTAIATGANSAGAKFAYRNVLPFPKARNVNAIGLLARGTSADVVAVAEGVPQMPGTGSEVKVVLEHSDYATTATAADTGGSAFVTPEGSGTNITAPPILAADGIHQLAASPTIDRGATDALSGAVDVDAGPRTLGAAADIGADEFAGGTTAALACAPATVAAGSATTCTATVATAASSAPTGLVSFDSNGKGALGAGGACNLVAAGEGKASCQVNYRPTQIGSGNHRLTAAYAGDATHGGSQATAQVKVSADLDAPRPDTKLKRKPRRQTVARLARFSFVSTHRGSSFQCKVDRKPFRKCRSPFKTRVKPGRHRFQVRAVDANGAVDPTPAAFRWRVRRS